MVKIRYLMRLLSEGLYRIRFIVAKFLMAGDGQKRFMVQEMSMDSLDYEDKHYQRRKIDLENHLYKTYDKIDEAEELLVSAKAKKRSLLADKITGDNIYKALIFFDKLYAQMNEAVKREFLSQFHK